MRLIDGDKLQEFPIRANHCDKEHANEHFLNGIATVLEYAEQLPTVDAEVVVRCKDCKSCRKLNRKDRIEEAYADGVLWCTNQSDGVWPDDFCSYGERKDGGNAEG